MARRSLRPQLNQIRAWVRQGRTDAWIAHQLEATVQQIQAFRREQGLDGDGGEAPETEELDLRAEDDALIAAELEEEAEKRAAEEAAAAAAAEAKAAKAAEAKAARAAKAAEARAARAKAAGEAQDGGDDESAAEDGADADGDAETDDDDAPKPARRRGRRGGRRTGRRSGPTTLEGTFDHGAEGYGLWLDPAVQDDPVYAEHWAGHRPVEVTVEEDQIVIRRAGGGDEDDE